MSNFVKNIAVILIVLTQTTLIFSQCDITASCNGLTNDTIWICQGDHINLQSTGDCDVYLMQNDFNDGTIGYGWSSNALPMFDNPCVAGPDGSVCLWIGPASNFPRELVTIPYSVNQSCRICFDMIYSVQGVSTPCEGPDLPAEGVHLQWSNNGGATWTDIDYWAPNGGHDPNLTSWNNYCCNVPVSGTSVQFRWFQTNTSGNNYDHWGLDNVIITCPSPPITVWWTGPGGFTYNNFNPPSYAPTQGGWYVVNITDGNYSSIDSVYVQISTPIIVTLDPVNPTLCYGQTSTLISSIVTGGSPPYNYLWSNGATTSSITVGQGTYSLVVTDIAGCFSSSASVTVTANTAPITADAGSDQTLCVTAGSVSLNGSVTVATGGIWSGGAGIFVPSNYNLNAVYLPTSAEISAGGVTLTLTTTGNGSCPPVSDNIIINFVEFLSTISITTTPISCYGNNNGTATAVVTGGNPPFLYLWNTVPLQSSATVVNLSVGTYVVTVTDGIGCTGTSSVSLTQPSELTAIITNQEVSCYGDNNGYATVSAFGGSPGYAYMWSNGSNGTTITGLSAGSYSVTVTDAMGCTVVANSTIQSPDLLTGSITSVIHVDCAAGNTGSATVIVTGGTPGYSFLWSSSAGSSATAVGLTAGTYYVTITDINGCHATTQVTITEPPLMNVNISSVDVSCYGGANGSATASVTGGTPPYMYTWSPYGGTSSTANSLIAGTYTLIITDNHACQKAVVVTISQPPPLQVTGAVQNVKCFNGNTGSAQVFVSGGTSPYTYTWIPDISTLPVATGLVAGNYMVTVQDANNCAFNLNLFVSQPLTPLSVTLVNTNIGCYGEHDGSISANVTGGTPPYIYLWQPGGSTSPSVSNLYEGNYFVTVTDANQCTVLQSSTISQPGGITLTASTIESICNNPTGQASVTPSGGTPPYSYLWSPGGATTSTISLVPSGIYSVTVTDASNCSQTGLITVNDVSGPQVSITDIQNASCFGSLDGSVSASVSGGTPPYTYSWFPYGGNSSTATDLGAGTYSVVVSDANGCQGFAYTNPAISQPPVISVTSSQTNVSCTGAGNGSTSLSVTGGTPPYTYFWSQGGYTIPNPTGLSQGVYQVTVTDQNNCEEYYFVDITEPIPLSATITSFQNIYCFGGNNGSATVTITGGTPPYTYLWSPSASTSSTASGLSAGTHTVYVNDSKGCSISASVFLSQPSPLSLISGSEQPSCNNGTDGMAWVFASGGIPPYSYSWSPSGGTNDTAFNLNAGIYYAVVIDSQTCQSMVPISIGQPSPVSVTISNFSNVSCFNGNNGYAIASVSGGTPVYTFLWSNGVFSPANTGLSAGYYSVTVSDSYGCTGSADITIDVPLQPLTVDILSQNVSCNSGNNGSAYASVTGGTPPYTYIWVPSIQFTSTAVNLIAGTYSVSVADINGCMATASVTISQPQSLTLGTYASQLVSCNGTNTGEATSSVSGGTPPYSYTWNTVPFQTTAVASDIFAGTYSITVTDLNGCIAVDSILIPEPPLLQVMIISQVDISCYNGTSGSAIGGAMGGTPPYTFSWNTTPVQSGQSVSGLSTGSYTLLVTDNNGCTNTAIVNIISTSQVITSVVPFEVICLGSSVTITANASGGTSPYMFHWNNGLGFGNSKTVSPVVDTEYIVNAYDANGCTGVPDTVSVHVLSLYPENVTVSSFSPICPGNSSQVMVTAQCSSFDILTYEWSHGLGPGSGPFVVVPVQETYYVVTVTNSCGFSVVDSAGVLFAPSPVIYFFTDTNQGCIPLTVEFTDSSFTTFDDINQWIWHFGDGNISDQQNTTYTYTEPGTYQAWLEVTTTSGCSSNSQSHPLPIYAFENPSASFTLNTTTVHLPNEVVICTNTSIGWTANLWDFGDGYTSLQENPQHTYIALGNYTITLIVTNVYTCSDTATQLIDATSDIVFPNVFTPNPDFASGGSYNISNYSNQVFFPYATGIDVFKMQIFNRWGELIFETNDIKIGWDGYYRGNICQQDVYVYKATATFVDGRTVEKIGDILILR
ncbi:MAG: PKD domain-containing protein [Bacteroidota bacterium]